MSDGQLDVTAQPLVIVRRRRSNGEEAHHGGVWKIAYADFMTAMMAFFLVMWLVNAADKKTIVQVAAYFNPVRLTEKSPSTKGLSDPVSGQKKQRRQQPNDSKADNSPDGETGRIAGTATNPSDDDTEQASQKPMRQNSKSIGQSEKDEILFSDPMGVLAQLAQKVDVPQPLQAKRAGYGAELRDPFDPASSAIPEQPASNRPDKRNGAAAKADNARPADGDLKSQSPSPSLTHSVLEAKAQSAAERMGQAQVLDRQIKQALAAMGRAVPSAEVEVTPEGLLISMTDSADFGMFAIGSAEPRPEMVVAVQKVGEIVKNLSGTIVVRGHTDGRAYRSGGYDNWRLSAARAQMSYHMLVRGGVDAGKFVAIEGRADRNLKLPEDNTAARNRRIEILIRTSAP